VTITNVLLRFKQFAQTYHHLAKSSRPMAKISWVIGSELLKENEGKEVLEDSGL
jgi:hypothetical protein